MSVQDLIMPFPEKRGDRQEDMYAKQKTGTLTTNDGHIAIVHGWDSSESSSCSNRSSIRERLSLDLLHVCAVLHLGERNALDEVAGRRRSSCDIVAVVELDGASSS